MLDREFAWIWVALLTIFLAVEIKALRNRKTGDTFTEFIRALTKPKPLRFTFAGFLVWLVVHFLFGV